MHHTKLNPNPPGCAWTRLGTHRPSIQGQAIHGQARILRGLAAVLLACLGSVQAQVTIKAIADTELKASASLTVLGGRAWYDYKKIPAGQDLGTSTTLSASVSPSAYSGMALATTFVAVSHVAMSAVVTDSATTSFSGNPLPSRSYNASCGQHAVALLFSSGVPTSGYLEITAGGGRPGSVMIDNRVINSGTAVVLTNRPLKVVVSSRVFSSVSSSSLRSQYSSVRVTFKPSASTLRTIGAPCGPELGAVYERTLTLKPQHLTLQVTGSKSPLYGMVLIGVQSLNVSFPPLGCVLRTSPLVVVPVSVSASGEVTLATPVPSTTPPGLFLVQYAAVIPHLGGSAWTMSNALELRVQ